MNTVATASQEASFHRLDIDGLRAVAVLPIVLFHAGVSALSGGFVGVDVFFVISGYLITRIYWREVQEGRFSIARFYERRIRRIIPALCFVLIFTVVAAAFLFLPEDFKSVPNSAIAALAFVSNIFFYRETGYFDAEAHVKPLLHTWSLAVEEQYYLIFPLLIIGLYRYARRRVVLVLALIAIGSLAAASVGAFVRPSFTFYMIPTRMWELLAGTLLACGAVSEVRDPRVREGIAAFGLLLIGATIFLLDETLPFPGLAAVPPVLGTVMLIHCGEGTFIARLLSLRPVVFIGLISFSLYLWHWPIVVFLGYLRLAEHPSWAEIAIAVALSVLMAWFSWRFVEQPFRRPRSDPRYISRRRVYTQLSAGAMLIVAISVGLSASHGISFLYSPRAIEMAHYAQAVSPKRKACHRDRPGRAIADSCVFGAPSGKPDTVVWGDSHGVELSFALGELVPPGKGLQELTYSGCTPVVEIKQDKPGCTEFNNQVVASLLNRDEVKTIIWVAYFDRKNIPAGSAEAARKTLTRLVATGKRIVIVYPMPRQPLLVPQAMAKSVLLHAEPDGFSTRSTDYRKRIAPAVADLDAVPGDAASVVRIYPSRMFCGPELCRAGWGDVPLYFDSNHPSLPGARILAREISRALGWAGAVHEPEQRVDGGGVNRVSR